MFLQVTEIDGWFEIKLSPFRVVSICYTLSMKKIILILLSLLFAFSLAGVDAQAACVTITHNLRFLSSDKTTGGDVSKLQTFLKNTGYLTAAPSGYFGGQTLTAVKKFQAKEGINATGYVGPVTIGKIANKSCGQSEAAPTPSITPTPVATGTLPVNLVPYITSLSTTSTPTDGVSPVVIFGTNFTSTSKVYLDGLSGIVIPPLALDPRGTSLAFSVPTSVVIPVSHQYKISVSNDGATTSNELTLAVTVRQVSSYSIVTGSFPDAKVGQSYYTAAQAVGFPERTRQSWTRQSDAAACTAVFVRTTPSSWSG